MLLCIGIIDDRLDCDVILRNYSSTNNPYVLERYEILKCGGVFSAGVLYLARAEHLPEEFKLQEGAALICIGMPPEAYVKSPLHIVVVQESADLIDLANDLSRIFFEYNTLEQKLQESVNKGRSIQYLVEIMSPYLNGNELTVTNNDYRIIGQSNKAIHLCEISGIEQPDSEGILSPEHVTFFKNDIIFSKVRDLAEPFFYESSLFICRVICKNIFHRGEYACRVVVAEDVNTFRGYEAGLLSFFSSYIQLIYDLSVDGSDISPRDNLVDIFIDLLNGQAVEAWRFENSFSHRKWSSTSSFICAKIMPSDRDYYNRTVRYYCQVFNRDIQGCCFFEFENVIGCVINLEFYSGSLEQFNANHLEIFRDGYFRIGYSNKFIQIEDLKIHYFQAKLALQMGLKMHPSMWYHKFADITLSYMGAKLTEDIDGRFLCAPELLDLRNYDNKNQTEFLRTLQVYIDNQMNAIKTANILFIHRATMVYRLDRIKELTGIDFKDPLKILHLSISFHLLFNDQ